MNYRYPVLLATILTCIAGNAIADTSWEEPIRPFCKKKFQLNHEDSRILKHADEYGFEQKHSKEVAHYNQNYRNLQKQADSYHCWVHTPEGQIAHFIFTL